MIKLTMTRVTGIAALLVSFSSHAAAQGGLNYYFAHIAAGGIWRTTFTYVNASTEPVTCTSSFYADGGSPLPLLFNGSAAATTSDTMPAGGTARRQTDAQPDSQTQTGWAQATCTGPVKASALFRSYNGNLATGEASVIAITTPATGFVTYGDQTTGVAYANPSSTAATVTFTARDPNGVTLASRSITLGAGLHGAQTLGALLSLASFTGSVTIASTAPIISLSLNFEAAPVFSSLPPGQADNLFGNGPATYYFSHIAAAGAWRTTFTYVNPSAAPVTCATSFYGDSGSPLALTFGGSAASSTRDVIPAGGIARRQTDVQPGLPTVTGWAMANCTGPVKASALFRSYNGNAASAEASVIAMTAAASRFVTYADQGSGIAYANPSASPATLTFTARNASGGSAATASLTLAAHAHGSAVLGTLLEVAAFQGSVTITATQPVISLSLNFEAAPSFSSLPGGEGGSFEIYGAWHCGNDFCNWKTVRNMTDFDSRNHWMIDRGDGSGLPSVNLVVLSFVQPTKLLALANDSATVNGIPAGMNQAVVNYFTSHNVRVMLSIGGATYTSDWDTALTTNATQLGINAAQAAQSLGVGIEIDYENDASPNLAGLQNFISAYRSIVPYDAAGDNPAARLTLDLAADDGYLVALAAKATSDWLTGSNPVLDFANATVANGLPTAAVAESYWQQHANGRPSEKPPVPPLPPARFTVAVRLQNGSTPEPECNNFAASLENSTGTFAQTLAPADAGASTGVLGYMFWVAEDNASLVCGGGIGTGATNYNIPIPSPPLRQQ